MERWFASAGGAGFDAQVAAAMSGRRGWSRSAMGYAIATLSELRRYGNRPLRVSIDDRPPIERTCLFVAVANAEYYGGGMRIAPGAEIGDGLLDVCLVGDISRAEAVRWLPRLYRGTHLANRNVELFRGRSVRIESTEPTSVHLDGEPFDALPVTMTLRPRALRIAGYASGS
jgi:diacylglycerol kinase (ATP)